MVQAALDIPSMKDKVSPEEWAVRVDLAACYRLLVRYGWEDLVFTHITARVPGTQDQFLINPYGLFFDEITASSLVKIDQDGNKLDNSPFSVNPAGFIIHNHGLLTVGETVAEAFVSMYYLETSCAIQVRAQSGGGELIPVPKEVLDDSYARLQNAQRPGGGRGGLVWPGLLRRLDRIDPSFRN